MVDRSQLLKKVIGRIAEVSELPTDQFSEKTVLIGPEASLSSMQLVGLLLELEEFMEDEYDVEFDWTSDSALSIGRSILRNVATLVEHLSELATSKA